MEYATYSTQVFGKHTTCSKYPVIVTMIIAQRWASLGCRAV